MLSCTLVLVFEWNQTEDMEKNIDDRVPVAEMEDLKKRMAEALNAIREKRNAFSIQDLKRMLFRCASSLITVAKVRVTRL